MKAGLLSDDLLNDVLQAAASLIIPLKKLPHMRKKTQSCPEAVQSINMTDRSAEPARERRVGR